MRTSGQLRDEHSLDRWIESGREATDDLRSGVAELARVALLVCQHVEAPVRGKAAPPTGRTPMRTPRIAAAVLLLAGLAVGLALVLSQSATLRPSVPLGGLTEAAMPAGLYQEVALQAGASGDPYPSAPVLWVRTTAAKVDRWLGPYHVPSQSKAPPALTEWVAEATGRFYGNPPERSDRFGSMVVDWVPYSEARRHIDTGSTLGGETSGYPLVPLAVLEQLGSVHREHLSVPSYARAAPGPYTGAPRSLPPALRTIMRSWLVDFEPFNGTLSLRWVGLTAAQLRGKVPWSDVPASLPANYSVWVVQLSEQHSAFGTMWWYVWPQKSSLQGGASSQGGSDLLGITRLSQLGRVHSVVGERAVVTSIGKP